MPPSTPVAAPVLPVVQPPSVQSPLSVMTQPKAGRPKKETGVRKIEERVFDDGDSPVTPEELQEANEFLKLGEDTAQRVRELRKGILEGRVNATKMRKRELGLQPEVRVRTPQKGIKIKAKYTKEQFEKYLETEKRLDEQRKKRLAEMIDNVMKGAE